MYLRQFGQNKIILYIDGKSVNITHQFKISIFLNSAVLIHEYVPEFTAIEH